MTLDEAIVHCKEKVCDNSECSNQHKQLAEWLEELKNYRKTAENKHIENKPF